MASVAQPTLQSPTGKATHRSVSLPVIVDSGDSAAVVLVTFPYRPRLGDRFRYLGTCWEITHVQSSLRGFVAQPACEPGMEC